MGMNTDGLNFAIALIFTIIIAIVATIVVSTIKVIKNKKEKKEINPICIVLITYGILIHLNQFLNELIIAITSTTVGIICLISKLKNKEKKYYVLGIIIYALMILYGLFYLGNIVFIPIG